MRELKQGGLLSVVLPSYNEEASIPRAAERITELLTAYLPAGARDAWPLRTSLPCIKNGPRNGA